MPTPAIVGLAPGAAELSVDAIGSVAGKPDPDSPNVPTVAFVTELPWGNPWVVGKKAADVAWLVCAGDAGLYPGGGAAIASGSSRSTGSSGRDSSPGALAGAPALAWTLAAKEPLRLLTGAPEETDVPWVMEALEWLEAAHELTAPEGDELPEGIDVPWGTLERLEAPEEIAVPEAGELPGKVELPEGIDVPW